MAGNKTGDLESYTGSEGRENELTPETDHERFEQQMLPHLDAAYNLARWLVRSPQDAEDMVQESMLRAVRFFSGFRGGDARAWLLTIVRNCCYSWLGRNRASDLSEEFDETAHSPAQPTPESEAVASGEAVRLRRALDEIPAQFREAIVLRELEGMSYKEIAHVTGVSIGTVMSRLARGRDRLKTVLVGNANQAADSRRPVQGLVQGVTP